MRREVVVAALSIIASPAHAETRVLVGADAYVATVRDVAIADVAWSAHVEWRDTLVIDYVQREPLLDGTPRRELHELAYTDRSLRGLAITIGRFRVPGGFWLMTDGVRVAREWSGVTLGAYAGSRSFTNGRADTLLTGDPSLLPLVGASLEQRSDDVQAQLAYTYTYDRIAASADLGSTRQPEQFVDGDIVALLGPRVTLIGGANIGSRYLVTSSANTDSRVANLWFGSQGLYAHLDARAGELRIGATLAALRTKQGHSSDEVARSGGDPAVLAAISGSFVEGTLRATWRREQRWRVDARYRMRGFVDGRQAHRAVLAAEWQRDTLGVQASAGFDVHRNGGPGYTDSRSLLYKAGIGRKTERTEVLLGAAAVSAIGDELSLTARDRDQRAPYTLEAHSYAFARAFATRGNWFAGIDAEYDLAGDGQRVLAQIGYGR